MGARRYRGSIRGCWMLDGEGGRAVSRVTEQVIRTLFDLVRDSPEEGGASRRYTGCAVGIDSSVNVAQPQSFHC